jgi:diguanylate cyclase (GGDEF)-like protein
MVSAARRTTLTNQESTISSKWSAFLVHIPVAAVMASLMWYLPISKPLVVVWSMLIALCGVLGSRTSENAEATDVPLLSVPRLSIYLHGFLFAALPWAVIGAPASVQTQHIPLFALAMYPPIALEFGGDRRNLRVPFLGVHLAHIGAVALSGEFGLTLLATFWSITIATIAMLSTHRERSYREVMTENLETARIDELTGLLGRTAFDQEIEAMLKRGGAYSLAIIDLDRFKVINDTLGHAYGDVVLREVGDRLCNVLPDSVVLGRRGGDEFAVLIPSGSERAVRGMLERVVSRVAEPIRHLGHTMRVEASAGVTSFSPGATAEQVLVEADLAMYRGKRSIGSRVTVFDQPMSDEISRRADLERRFRAAIENGDIVFWGQPIVRVSDGSPIGLELLARWPQADGSLISPGEFIPIAEETGLITDLGQQALACATKLLTQFANHPELETVRVNVNISPLHVGAGLERDVRSAVHKIPDATMLGLEFVETGLISQAEVNNSVLQNLRDLGVRVVIDDFGVGYSSLTYLRSFPISDLKIDRSFIDGIHKNRTQQVLTHAIWQMTNELDIPVVAEGVETDEDLEMIRALEIHAAQGFGIARPEPLGESVHTLRRLARKSNRLHNEAIDGLRQVVHDLRTNRETIELRDGVEQSA